jgi:peptidoglycan/xylan/chitin deacetylase (PgdA/CDA1 family)
MKAYQKRWISLALAVLLAVLSLPLRSPRVDAAASLAPTLYCNDDVWYMDARLPLVRYYSAYLVPVSIFEMFDDFEVVVDRREGEFMIINRKDNLYMTFNYTASYAMTDKGEEFYFVSHRMYSTEYYISAETVCEYLNLECEIYTSPYDGSVCLRISDDTAEKPLSDLLLEYNPAALGAESLSPNTGIEPYAKGKKVFFTFEGIHETYTDRILDILRRTGVKATFFLTEEEIAKYPSTVIRIYSEGHSIGIYIRTKVENSVLNFDDIMAQLGRANQRLYQLLKIRTRLIRTDLSMANTTRILAGVHYENLKYCGYVLWNYNNVSLPYVYSTEQMHADIIQTVSSKTIPVLSVPNTEYGVTALASAIEELMRSNTYAFLNIAPSMQEYNYIENIQ